MVAASMLAGSAIHAADAPPAPRRLLQPFGHYFYRVVSGDTLSRLADRFYGSQKRLPGLAAINGLRDPGKIQTGQAIEMPFRGTALDGWRWYGSEVDPPLWWSPGLEIEADLGGAGSAIRVSFDPERTDFKLLPDGNFEVSRVDAVIRRDRAGAGEIQRVPLLEKSTESVVKSAAVWQVSPGCSILGVEWWGDGHAAVASADSTLILVRLDPAGAAKKVGEIKGLSGVQHESVASGARWETDVKAYEQAGRAVIQLRRTSIDGGYFEGAAHQTRIVTLQEIVYDCATRELAVGEEVELERSVTG
jgi:LysM repeat protein